MIKTEPFNGVQGVHSVGKRDELYPNQCVIGTTIVNVPLSFHTTSDEGRKQGAWGVLHDVVVVEKQEEKGVSCSHIEVQGKELFDLKITKRHIMSEIED